MLLIAQLLVLSRVFNYIHLQHCGVLVYTPHISNESLFFKLVELVNFWICLVHFLGKLLDFQLVVAFALFELGYQLFVFVPPEKRFVKQFLVLHLVQVPVFKGFYLIFCWNLMDGTLVDHVRLFFDSGGVIVGTGDTLHLG